MTSRPYDIAALLGSRICHDLISPLGAIGNGVELLNMVGTVDGPEMSLISDSVNHANARIRFFRIAFGAGSDVTRIGRAEIEAVLADLGETGRLTINWDVSGDITRNEAKFAFLLIMCLELAMPYGGEIRIAQDGRQWTGTGSADKLKVDPELWQLLSTPGSSGIDVTPGQVQFLLAADLAHGRDTKLRLFTDAQRIRIEY